jgi:hypothetical protein
MANDYGLGNIPLMIQRERSDERRHTLGMADLALNQRRWEKGYDLSLKDNARAETAAAQATTRFENEQTLFPLQVQSAQDSLLFNRNQEARLAAQEKRDVRRDDQVFEHANSAEAHLQALRPMDIEKEQMALRQTADEFRMATGERLGRGLRQFSYTEKGDYSTNGSYATSGAAQGMLAGLFANPEGQRLASETLGLGPGRFITSIRMGPNNTVVAQVINTNTQSEGPLTANGTADADDEVITFPADGTELSEMFSGMATFYTGEAAPADVVAARDEERRVQGRIQLSEAEPGTQALNGRATQLGAQTDSFTGQAAGMRNIGIPALQRQLDSISAEKAAAVQADLDAVTAWSKQSAAERGGAKAPAMRPEVYEEIAAREAEVKRALGEIAPLHDGALQGAANTSSQAARMNAELGRRADVRELGTRFGNPSEQAAVVATGGASTVPPVDTSARDAQAATAQRTRVTSYMKSLAAATLSARGGLGTGAAGQSAQQVAEHAALLEATIRTNPELLRNAGLNEAIETWTDEDAAMAVSMLSNLLKYNPKDKSYYIDVARDAGQ